MHRFVRFAAIAALAAAVLGASACGARRSAEPTAPAGTSDGSLSAEVVVPDVIMAIEKHRRTPRYTRSPDATELMLEAYTEGFLEAAGLEPDVRSQPTSASDSQEPSAGVVVPRGSVVHVRIGSGG